MSIDPARVREIARICYEANRGYVQALGDNSFKPWDEAPQWQQDTCVDGVHFKLSNPETTPSQSHSNWWSHKMRSGWSYGEVKDPELKTHPCMKPYNELPVEQRAKDHIFQAIVEAMWL